MLVLEKILHADVSYERAFLLLAPVTVLQAHRVRSETSCCLTMGGLGNIITVIVPLKGCAALTTMSAKVRDGELRKPYPKLCTPFR